MHFYLIKCWLFQEKPTIKIELLSAKDIKDSFENKYKTTPTRLPVQSYGRPPLPPRSNVVTRLHEQSSCDSTKF